MLKIFKNKVIVFIFTRYFSYFIQFLNSLIIAYVLGPYFLGIWGFLALVMQYLNFGNFGVDIALNVNLSTGELSDTKKQSEFSSNAFIATIFTSLIYLLAGIVIYIADIPLFEKYGFTPYLMPVILISCLNYFNVLFVNICRTYSLFTPISIFQTLVQLLQLPVFFIFKDTELIWSLLWMMIVAHIISLVLFLKRLPVKISLKVNKEVIKNLYRRGLSLLSYAITFYILFLSTRSMVGYFYPVETMGLFTFSASISSALIVGLSSLEFVLFPKMLNRLSADEITEKSLTTFEEVRYIYMATAFFVVILGLLFYPFLLLYFEAYQPTIKVFTFLVIGQVVISTGFGYSTLIISKGKEFFLVVRGLIALLINLLLSLAAIVLFKIDYSYMALLLIFSFLYYDFQVIKKGRELLKLNTKTLVVLRDFIPLRFLPALFFIFCAVITDKFFLFYLTSLLSFFIFNFKGYHLVKKYLSMLFNEPEVVNIKNDA